MARVIIQPEFAGNLSCLLSAVHETARDLHRLVVIDKRTMQEYDFLCV
jgi:hypothetical protein